MKKHLSVIIPVLLLLLSACGNPAPSSNETVLVTADSIEPALEPVTESEPTTEPISEPTSEPTPDPSLEVISFQDAKFEAKIRKIIDKPAGSITRGDVETVTELDIRGTISIGAGQIETTGEIESLSGIEYFTALEVLLCGANKMTELDVSSNTGLKVLDCSWGKLTELIIGDNTALEWLDCSYNVFLTSLDVSGCISLIGLDCSNNKLSELDLSKNLSLQQLSCTSNGFSSLDVSNNSALETLFCSTDLNISGLDETKTEITRK